MLQGTFSIIFVRQVTDIRECDKNCEICGQSLQFAY